MKTAVMCLLGGMATLILVATLEMRRASHARSSAGDIYHKVISHAEGGQDWHLSFDELKEVVHKRHHSQEGGSTPRNTNYGEHMISGLGEHREHFDSQVWSEEQLEGQFARETQHPAGGWVQAERKAPDHGLAGGWVKQEDSHQAAHAEWGQRQRWPQQDADTDNVEEEEGEEGEKGEEADGDLEPQGSQPLAGKDKGSSKKPPADISSRDEDRLGSPKPKGAIREHGHGTQVNKAATEFKQIHSGSSSKTKADVLPQMAAVSKQRVVQPPPGTREAVANGLRRITPLKLRVANMMGTPIRLNGVPGTIKPCFIESGKIGICRNSRGRPQSGRKKEEKLDGADDGIDEEQDPAPPVKLQPGDQGYQGVDMYKYAFFGSIVMNQEKYSRYQTGDPLRIVKYKSQCALGEWDKPDSPPRGCDSSAAKLWNRSRGYDRIGQINPVFMALLPPEDVFAQRPMYTSCAVVGNGGSLLLNEMGPEIDRHEAIIRFNGGITKGFEQHVGSRTTVRFLNTQHIGFHEFADELLIQHATNMATMEQVLTYKLKNPKLSMYITDADFHQYVLDEMGDGAASNGFYGTVFAREMCAQVTLFGFYKNWGAAGQDFSATIKYHYYDKVEPNVSQKSRDDKETPALLEFLSKNRNKFQFGEPTAVGAVQFGR